MKLYAVCMSCLSVMSMFTQGTSRAMIPIIGVLYGEKDYSGIRLLANNVMKFALSLTGTFVAFTLIFPQVILSLFNLPAELVIAGTNAVRLFSVSLLGVTAAFMMIYYYTTVQQRTVANILSCVEGLFVVVPSVWLFSKIMGLHGVWLAFIVAEISGFIF